MKRSRSGRLVFAGALAVAGVEINEQADREWLHLATDHGPWGAGSRRQPSDGAIGIVK